MLRFLNKLNSPQAVILVLIMVLALNGFLFYQFRAANSDDADAPDQGEPQTQETADTGPERTPEPEEEPEQTIRQPQEDEQNDEPEPQENEESASQSQESQNNATEEDENREEDNREEDNQNDENREDENREDENQTDENRDGEEQASGDRPSGSTDDSREEPEGEADAAQGERETPEQEATLAGLGEAIRGCEGEDERCIREFVARVAPESSYIGGRTDLVSGQNTEVLYFEDPGMEACEFEREKHEAENGPDYTVILVGPGSFDDERGEECIPTA
ncbi:MAG: hypothetical protein ACRDSJ_13770 [Rubrobacteraceae bacterium]